VTDRGTSPQSVTLGSNRVAWAPSQGLSVGRGIWVKPLPTFPILLRTSPCEAVAPRAGVGAFALVVATARLLLPVAAALSRDEGVAAAGAGWLGAEGVGAGCATAIAPIILIAAAPKND